MNKEFVVGDIAKMKQLTASQVASVDLLKELNTFFQNSRNEERLVTVTDTDKHENSICQYIRIVDFYNPNKIFRQPVQKYFFDRVTGIQAIKLRKYGVL